MYDFEDDANIVRQKEILKNIASEISSLVDFRDALKDKRVYGYDIVWIFQNIEKIVKQRNLIDILA